MENAASTQDRCPGCVKGWPEEGKVVHGPLETSRKGRRVAAEGGRGAAAVTRSRSSARTASGGVGGWRIFMSLLLIEFSPQIHTENRTRNANTPREQPALGSHPNSTAQSIILIMHIFSEFSISAAPKGLTPAGSSLKVACGTKWIPTSAEQQLLCRGLRTLSAIAEAKPW